MNKISLEKIEKFLATHARPVDHALYRYYFQNGEATIVIQELAKFQNDDGGFGNGIEADLCLPQSTAVATWMAFQYIKAINADPQDNNIRRGLDYFIETYDPERNGWAIVRPEVDDYPHAPWWDYKTAMAHFGWGNPSAEILGLLMNYSEVVEAGDIIEPLTEKALERIQVADPSTFHEILNFKALYELADNDLRTQLKEPLTRLIQDATCTTPEEWASYVATPLRFIEAPDEPFAYIFSESLIQQNLDFLMRQIVDDDHWEPNWDWAGNYPEQWKRSRIEWSGHLTVRNLRILKNFGQV